MPARDPYWQAVTDAITREFEPGAPFLTSSPGADNLGGEAPTRFPAPFLLSPRFWNAASRPTPHEWLTAKRIERGVVCPFKHSREVCDG